MQTFPAVLLASILFLMLLAAPSHAGVYTVHTCRTPDGVATDRGSWDGTSRDWDTATRHNRCPKRPFEFVLDPNKAHPANDWARLTFWAPAGTEIAGYRLWRSAQLARSYNYRLRENRDNGYPVREICRGCGNVGNEKAPFDKANRVSVRGLQRTKAVDLLLTCGHADTSSDPCSASAKAAQLQLHRAEIDVRDDLAPYDVQPSGPLVSSSQPLTGEQPLSVAARDDGGGVYQVAFEVDGAVVQRTTLDANAGQCREPFRKRVPCKTVAAGTINFDTAQLPDGQHSLRILVSDATGENVTPWGPVTVTTANSACSPEPRVDSLDLTAAFATRRGGRPRRAVATRYGRKLRVRGMLRTRDGRPIPRAPLCVATRTALPGAPLQPQGGLVTDEAGRFSWVMGRGPSRRAYFVARVPGGAVSTHVLARVRAPVRLAASRRRLRNGQVLSLRGQLRGRPLPRRGVLVELQVRRGRGYQTFGTARTKRRGRFMLRYRFTRTRGVQSYRFRARVPRQSTYPYATGSSRSVTVRVTG